MNHNKQDKRVTLAKLRAEASNWPA